ncbi:MAG TPA: TolC family protein [Haliscomenobacter sp.]|uniref:TolC family protein n=1 Tax=Haliscomenobacter sp. TaxID=2717303 RepID=UPI002CE3E701|nr:TolC family protein [Haliscomenobacter sp.]HOY20593.1 TolC family protein [Haliscomenobacter sp.]
MKLVNIHTLVVVLGILLIGQSRNVLHAQTQTLPQCIAKALSNNKNLQVVRNNLNLNQLRQQEARSNLLPKATVLADYKFFTNLPYQLLPLSVFNGPEGQYKEAQFGVPHNLATNIQLALPLYNPQIKAGVKGVEIAADMGTLQVEKSEEQVIFEVTNLYYNAQIVQHQRLFVDSNLVNVDRLLATMRLLRAQGLAKGTDIVKVELQQAQLQAQRLQLDGKLAQVLNSLKFFMGQNLDTLLSIPTGVEPMDKLEYPVSASVDARMMQVQNRILVNELDLLKKSKLPTVSVVASYGLAGFGYGKQPDPFFKIFPTGFIGAQTTYPIWNRTTRFKLAQKQVEITSNRLQLEQIQAQNDLQVANAILQRNTAQANIPTARQQIALANSVYQQTLVQQQQGTANITDILMADNDLRGAQNQYLNTLVEYLKADLELKKASSSLKN